MKQKVAVAAAALAVVGGGVVVGAPTASAATVGLTIDCNNPAVLTGAVPGDTIVITMTTDCQFEAGVFWNINDLANNGPVAGFLSVPSQVLNSPYWFIDERWSGSDWFVYSDGSGTTQITTTLLATDDAGNPLQVGSVIAAMGPTNWGTVPITYGGAGRAANPSPSWVQAYGRASADSACDEGWSPSWDLWANDGTGGWVCVRSVPEFGAE